MARRVIIALAASLALACNEDDEGRPPLWREEPHPHIGCADLAVANLRFNDGFVLIDGQQAECALLEQSCPLPLESTQDECEADESAYASCVGYQWRLVCESGGSGGSGGSTGGGAEAGGGAGSQGGGAGSQGGGAGSQGGGAGSQGEAGSQGGGAGGVE